ncbi:hypothetical protein [Pseudoxanthomonas sp. 10H]|uniref:hypothetical protein n=1 Tax=Pseudoxanthomonas sp. 10H TaxID=3242729 RepID=UPI003556CF7E
MDTKHAISAILLAGAASIAQAKDPGPPIGECVDLGPDRDVLRTGNMSALTLRDGTRYYLIELRDACNSLRSVDAVSIRARGVDGRICPTGTRVQTGQDICLVKRIRELPSQPVAEAAPGAR